jgi:nucleotide-binding universal stress UspA family protein
LPSDPLLPHLHQQLAIEWAAVRAQLAAALQRHVVAITGRAPEDFDVVVEEGIPYDVIAAQAERMRASLVVVGAHDDRGPLDRLLHRTGVRILRFSPCPVLVARGGGDGAVVAGTDFSEPSQRAVAAAAAEARRVGARLTLVHAIDLQPTLAERAGMAFGAPGYVLPESARQTLRQAVEARLGALLERCEIAGRTRVVEGAPVATLLHAVVDERARLLVLGTLGRTGLPRLLLGSVAENAANQATCPVLVVR